jgi:fermentation-respiration switch protein FrsA (DUF1100 family)
MWQWLLTLIIAAVALWLFFRWFERANVYQPTPAWWATGDDLRRAWEDVRFKSRDGLELSGWFFPAAADGQFADVVILISHGNGGNISHRLSLYEVLLGIGVNVFTYDYRGYGKSEGRPGEEGTYLDGEAAIEWLNRRGFSDPQIVAHGESLGAAIAAELARRHPRFRGLVLRSTFTSIPDIGVDLFPFLPVRLLSTIRYDTRAKLSEIRVPVLILHSREDTLIRFHHAESNFAAANPPKWLREIRGDHNDQPDASPGAYADAVRELLRATGK